MSTFCKYTKESVTIKKIHYTYRFTVNTYANEVYLDIFKYGRFPISEDQYFKYMHKYILNDANKTIKHLLKGRI